MGFTLKYLCYYVNRTDLINQVNKRMQLYTEIKSFSKPYSNLKHQIIFGKELLLLQIINTNPISSNFVFQPENIIYGELLLQTMTHD